MSTNATIAKNNGFTIMGTNHFRKGGVFVSKLVRNQWCVYTAEGGKVLCNPQSLGAALAEATKHA